MSGIAAAALSQEQAGRILDIVAARLRVVRTGPLHVAPGAQMLASLVPGSLDLDASDLVNAAVDVAAVTKDMFFKDAKAFPVADANALTDPKDFLGTELIKDNAAALDDGRPFNQPPTLLQIPASITSHVPGLLAQLFGTLQLPDLRISLNLSWILCNAHGVPQSEGKDFLALDGLANPAVSLVVAPPFGEYRHDTLLNPGGEQFCLWLRVDLHLGGFQREIMLGPIPFIQLPVLVPTVVGLFSEPNFDVNEDSAALLVVPAHSPFVSLEPLLKLLETLDNTLSALKGLGKVAAFLLGLSDVLGAIPETPRLRLTAKNRIDDLENYEIKARPWYAIFSSDDTFDDRVNSLFVLGVPGTVVEFFNDEDCEMTDQGGYTITLNATATLGGDLPDFFVAIPTLYAPNEDPPPTMPPGRISSFTEDTTGDGSWDTDMTSLKFGDDFLQDVEKAIKAGGLPFPELACARIKFPKPTHPVSDPPVGVGRDKKRKRKGRE